MGEPLMSPGVAQLASSLRARLEQLLPAARSGRGRDLDFAAASLEAAIGDLGALLRGLAPEPGWAGAACGEGADRVGLRAHIDEISVRREIESCRRLTGQLAELLEQAREIRLAHWSPAADGTYTAQGSPAPAAGPRLVRQLG